MNNLKIIQNKLTEFYSFYKEGSAEEVDANDFKSINSLVKYINEKITEVKSERLCLIRTFISKVKLKYPDINIDFYYDEYEYMYSIYHNNYELEFNDEEFSNFIGVLIIEIFFNNGVFDVTFSYDYDYDIKKSV